MTTKEDLHILIDWLPEGTWDEVNRMLLEYLAESDEEEGDYFFLDAPEVEPTPAEIAVFEEYYADLKAGRVETIPHAEVVEYLMELP